MCLSLYHIFQAYLVLQNITLIDKVMDAENTVQTLRLMNEVEQHQRKAERPYTFAAPDTDPDSLPRYVSF